MTLIEQKQVQAMSKLSAQIHCQLSKYWNHIQNGEWHKVTCQEEHQLYQLSKKASNVLVERASGTDNGRGATRTNKDKFHVSTSFMSQTHTGVDIFQRLQTVSSQRLIRYFNNTTELQTKTSEFT